MSDRENTQGVRNSTYRAIRRDVITGKLQAESKLKLSGLEKRYGVSALTLRNALYSLDDEGFVVAEEQRGFFVAPLTRKNLKELADLRYLLESHMTEISFTSMNLEWESGVLSSHHKLQGREKEYLSGGSDDDELSGLKLADYEFHCTLISGCGSTEMLKLYKTVFDKYLRYLFHYDAFRGAAASEEHKILAESALSHDVSKAKKVLKTHIYECVTSIEKLLPK